MEDQRKDWIGRIGSEIINVYSVALSKIGNSVGIAVLMRDGMRQQRRNTFIASTVANQTRKA